MNNYLLTCEKESVRVNMYEGEAIRCAESMSKRHKGKMVKIEKVGGCYTNFIICN